jgi:hypothetical protein
MKSLLLVYYQKVNDFYTINKIIFFINKNYVYPNENKLVSNIYMQELLRKERKIITSCVIAFIIYFDFAFISLLFRNL